MSAPTSPNRWTKPGRRLPRRLGRNGRILLGIAAPVFIIVAWQIAKSTGGLPYQNLPAPSAIVQATIQLVASGDMQTNVLHTVIACLSGWAIGSAIGLLFGVLLGVFRPAWVYSMASVEVLRAIPAIAFVTIAVIIFSQTLLMEIVIAAWVSVWPVAISAIDGVRDVTEMHRDLARSMRLSRLRVILMIDLPTAAPKIFVSLRLSLSGALALAVVAEIVGNPHGVGYALVEAQQALRPDAMFSYILIIGAVGLIFNGVLSLIFRKLLPGAQRSAHEGSGA